MKISKQIKKDVAKELDSLIDFNKYKGKSIVRRSIFWLLERFDSKIYLAVLNALDDHFGNKIPQKFEDEVNTVLTSLVNKDYDAMLSAIPSALNEFRSWPWMPNDYRGQLIKCNFEALMMFLKHIAEQRKG